MTNEMTAAVIVLQTELFKLGIDGVDDEECEEIIKALDAARDAER